MKQLRWQTVQRLVQAAGDKSEKEAKAFFDAACNGDVSLRDQVWTFYRSQRDASQFLEAPLIPVADSYDPVATGSCWQSESHFRILQKFGQGGMGEVYLARQEKPVQRDVALKVMRSDLFSKQATSRFSLEYRLLATLDHAGVARIFDVGMTRAGRPFFTMEWIDGMALDLFCQHQQLNINQRLALFLQICDAMAHVHNRGIVHRDLKPSNILVTMENNRPCAKVIDFGIAKNLGEAIGNHAHHTTLGMVMGTPVFMAPEQANPDLGEVDVRADIYAMGAIMHQLLCGQPPFDPKRLARLSIAEIVILLREEDPPTPSASLAETKHRHDDQNMLAASRAWQKLIQGDLDWIVQKAMAKMPCHRYASVSGLKADVESYLNGRPIVARPPTLRYRSLKFIRRHRALVTASVLVILSLLVGLITSTLLYLDSLQHKRELLATNRQLEESNQNYRDLSRLMFKTIDAAGPSHAGAETPLFDWLQNAAPYIDQAGEQESYLNARFQYRYGKTTLALGQYDRACQHLHRSLQFFMRQAGPDDPETLMVWWRWCEYLIAIGQYRRAEEQLQTLLAEIPHKAHGNLPVFYRARFSLARAIGGQARLDESICIYADTLQRQWDANFVDDAFAIGLRGYANVLIEDNRPAEAELLLSTAHNMLVDQFGANHAQVLETQFSFAWLRKLQARYSEAYELYCQYYHEAARRFGSGSVEAIKALRGMAYCQQSMGRMDSALAYVQQAVGHRSQRSIDVKGDLLSLLYQWAYYNQSPVALSFMQDSWQDILSKNPNQYKAEELELGNNLADRLRRDGRFEAALNVQQVALSLYREDVGEKGPEMSVFFCTLAEIQWALGLARSAENNFTQAILLAEEQQHRYLHYYQSFLGLLRCQQGRLTEGLPTLERGWRGLRQISPISAAVFQNEWQYFKRVQDKHALKIAAKP